MLISGSVRSLTWNARAAGAQRDPPRRRRRQLHQPDRARATSGRRVGTSTPGRSRPRASAGSMPSRLRALAHDAPSSGAGSGAARTTAGSSRARRTRSAGEHQHGDAAARRSVSSRQIVHHRPDERVELVERAGVHVARSRRARPSPRRAGSAARAPPSATAERARRSVVGAVTTTTLSNRPSRARLVEERHLGHADPRRMSADRRAARASAGTPPTRADAAAPRASRAARGR